MGWRRSMVASWGWGMLWGLGCGSPRGVELPSPCDEDADCEPTEVCAEDGVCAEPDPLPWDELEGVQHFEASARNPNWDILLVLDDSSSMSQWQATLAANFGAWIETLESEGVEASYRLGITTTSELAEDAAQARPGLG